MRPYDKETNSYPDNEERLRECKYWHYGNNAESLIKFIQKVSESENILIENLRLYIDQSHGDEYFSETTLYAILPREK